ncbi:hypothetical protein E2C01_071942 [Portunus trituberculatus]|uniref:Uncharacterized protein n=1 Tax=Portunus trituberculatus TaxID=210409 RepID=A0A5B7I7M0_PORTR|nr:hypothetical protein [Portunus trituberculatus]
MVEAPQPSRIAASRIWQPLKNRVGEWGAALWCRGSEGGGEGCLCRPGIGDNYIQHGPINAGLLNYKSWRAGGEEGEDTEEEGEGEED